MHGAVATIVAETGLQRFAYICLASALEGEICNLHCRQVLSHAHAS